ncbi:MAG: peptidoglycan editing factor PgeF [Deltaproteobacteria bacterium]|nr:peptidoglycan editing factor PgeF [Deltaproteobacteria bacterium]
MSDFPCLTAPGLKDIPGLVHAFLGRIEQPADGPPLCSHGHRDPLCHVKTTLGLDGCTITTMKQVHGDAILDVAETRVKTAGEADAMASGTPGVFLAVQTADCVPALVVDPVRRVCAAVHAGWRGALAGIAGKAVAHLRDHYGCDPADVRVAFGPAIGRCCFEVGPEVIAAFEKKMGETFDAYVDRKGEKGRVDLRGLVARQLTDAGLRAGHLETVGGCTFCSEKEFFSYRRDGKTEGRQITLAGFSA